MDAVTLGSAKSFAKKAIAQRVAPGIVNAPFPGTAFATRAHAMSSTQAVLLSNGTDTYGNYRYAHTALYDAVSPRFAFKNYYPNSTSDADGPNDITVRAAIETPSGTYYPLYFNGVRDVVIKPGQTVVSDPIGIMITSGTVFYSRTNVSVTSGGKWPTGLSTVAASLEGVVRGSGANSDLTTSGTITAATENGYGPCAIVGSTYPRRRIVVGICGDSIACGTGDGGADLGWIVRQLQADKIGYIHMAQRGEAAGQFNPPYWIRRLPYLASCTDVLCEYGVNDLIVPRTLALIQSYLINIWRAAQLLGARAWQTTITPRTTSTDGWTTTTNQTQATFSTPTTRTDLNDWIRAGAPVASASNLTAVAVGTAGALVAGQSGHPLSGYFEIADAVESARNSGLWTPGYTSDGVHPNATAVTAIRANFVTSRFTD